jgi:hypothetical protein
MDQSVPVCQVCVNAGVHNLYFDTTVPRQHVNSGAAAQKVVNHLRSDFARVSADTFGCNAMISGDHVDSFAVDVRGDSFLDCSETVAKVFETAQATGWFGQRQLSFVGRVQPRLIDGLNVVANLSDK